MMKLRISGAQPVIVLVVTLCAMGSLMSPTTAAAQHVYVNKVVTEKKLNQLPAGPLFWQVDNFPTLTQALAAAGDMSLAAEVAGKVWLFTLGPMGGSARGERKIVEIGPVPPVTASEYLLSINYLSAPPGTTTLVRTHQGSEAFYVLAGRLSQKTPRGVKQVWAGQSMNGYGDDMPVQVSSSGTSDLNAQIMFVVDATKSIASPAEFDRGMSWRPASRATRLLGRLPARL